MPDPEVIEESRALAFCREGGSVFLKTEPRTADAPATVEVLRADGTRFMCFTRTPELFPNP